MTATITPTAHSSLVGGSTASRPVCLRLDTDIVEWFKAQGPRYQTFIMQVLRDHVAVQTSAQKERM